MDIDVDVVDMHGCTHVMYDDVHGQLWNSVKYTQISDVPSSVRGVTIEYMTSRDVTQRFVEVTSMGEESSTDVLYSEYTSALCPRNGEQRLCRLCTNDFRGCLGHMGYVRTLKMVFNPIHFHHVVSILNSVVTLQTWNGRADVMTNPRVYGIASIGLPIEVARATSKPATSSAAAGASVRYVTHSMNGGAIDTIKRAEGERGSTARPMCAFNAMYTLARHDEYLEMERVRASEAGQTDRCAELDECRHLLACTVTHVIPITPACSRPRLVPSGTMRLGGLNDFYEKVMHTAAYARRRWMMSADVAQRVEHLAAACADDEDRLHAGVIDIILQSRQLNDEWDCAFGGGGGHPNKQTLLADLKECFTIYAVWMMENEGGTMTILRRLVRFINDYYQVWRPSSIRRWLVIRTDGQSPQSIARQANRVVLSRVPLCVSLRDVIEEMGKSDAFDLDAHEDRHGKRTRASGRVDDHMLFPKQMGNLSVPYHATMLFRQTPGAHHRRKIDQGVLAALAGKEGALRTLAIAKRVSKHGRSVIVPGPKLSCLEVVIPRRVLRTVTQKFVCKANLVSLARDMLRAGQLVRIEHDGALKNVTTHACSSRMCGVCHRCIEETLDRLTVNTHGMIMFRRTLRENDYVIVNRQPSLSRRSMQALSITHTTCQQETMSLPPHICDQFNADFDGDEMNQHMCEGSVPIAECHFLMSNLHNWNENVVLLQDMVHGLFMLGTDGTRLDASQFHRLAGELLTSGLDVARLGAVRPTVDGTYTGFDVLDLLLHVAPDFPMQLSGVFPGAPSGPSPLIRPIMQGSECFVQIGRGSGVMLGPTPSTICRERALREPNGVRWRPGRLGAGVALHLARLHRAFPSETIRVPAFTVVHGKDVNIAIVVTRVGTQRHVIGGEDWEIEVVASEPAGRILLPLPSDARVLAVDVYTDRLVGPTGECIPRDAPVTLSEVLDVSWAIEGASGAVLAGNSYSLCGRGGLIGSDVRFVMTSFPVNKKTIRGSLMRALRTVDSVMAVRILDAGARIGALTCDMFGCTLAYQDLFIHTPEMHARVGTVLRDVDAFCAGRLDEIRRPSDGSESAYARYILPHENAYSAFCRDVVSYINSRVDEPIRRSPWTAAKFITNGSCSKGDEGKLREISVMAGLRDIEGELPYGSSSRALTPYLKCGPSSSNIWDPTRNGLLTASYLSGIRPETNFFEDQTSLVNTASSKLLIQQAGYSSRKVTLAEADLVVSYAFTIEDNGRIITTYVPALHPDHGTDPIDIERLVADPGALPAAANHGRGGHALSDDEISAGLDAQFEPNGAHLAKRFASCIARSSLSQSQKTFIYFKVRRMVASMRLSPGTPLGLSVASQINQKFQQAALDSFHNTSGSKNAMTNRLLLEQRRTDHHLQRQMVDPFSMTQIQDCSVSVRVAPEASRGVFLALHERTFQDVVVSMEVVSHAWLGTLDPQQPSTMGPTGVMGDRRPTELAMELWDAIAARMATDGSIQLPLFTTTMRIELSSRLSLIEAHEVRRALIVELCGAKSRSNFRWAWTDPDVRHAALGAVFHVMVARSTSSSSWNSQWKQEKRGKKSSDSEGLKRSRMHDDDSAAPVHRRRVHAMETDNDEPLGADFDMCGSDDDDDDDSDSSASDASSESTPDGDGCLGDDGDDNASAAAASDSSESSESSSEDDGSDDGGDEDDAADLSDEEVADEDEEEDRRVSTLPRRSRKTTGSCKSMNSEESVLEMFLKIASGNQLPAVPSCLTNARVMDPNRLTVRDSRQNAQCTHKLLDRGVWRGLPCRGSSVTYERDTSTLQVPDCRIERIVARATRDMVLTSIRSTRHANNVDVLGIEAATRIMRFRLYKLWPDMPRFYIFMLCEHMSFTGTILAVNNEGIASTKGFFTRWCFEKAVKHLTARKGVAMHDSLDSQMARTFMGLPINVGTALPSVYTTLDVLRDRSP